MLVTMMLHHALSPIYRIQYMQLMNIEIDSIIAEHEKNCDLSKRYFYATYKTCLMKYDGDAIPPKDRGNIISRTYAFEAASIEDAKRKAPSMFNICNLSFNPLVRSKMQVEHELLDMAELGKIRAEIDQFLAAIPMEVIP